MGGGGSAKSLGADLGVQHSTPPSRWDCRTDEWKKRMQCSGVQSPPLPLLLLLSLLSGSLTRRGGEGGVAADRAVREQERAAVCRGVLMGGW